MSRSLRYGCMGLTLALVAMAGCRSDRHPPAETPKGTVSLALTGSAQGIAYRLRNARFVITAPDGAQQSLDSELDPAAMFLTTTLAAGPYTIELQTGWALQRTDTAQVVDAILTSPNPTTFQILASSTTQLTYRFSTSGGVVDIGAGTLSIGIEVSVTGDGGVPDGAPAACTVSPNSCPAGSVCQTFAGSTDGSTFTRCVLTCDPITQRRSDGAPACGSLNPAAPDLGCYGVNDVYSCARVVNPLRTHGMPAAAPGETVYLNSCAAGSQPLFTASSTDQTPVCTAFCRPAPTLVGNVANAGGVAPHSCADRGAPAGTECRYLSWIAAQPSSLGNSIGVCLNPAVFTYDHDANPATSEVPYPSCATLTASDTNSNGTPDYLEWGCGPLPLP